MATVPFTGLQDQPAAPGTIIPDDMQRISSTPDDFGAQIGTAETGDARDLQQVGQNVQQIIDLHNHAAADEATNSFMQIGRNAAYGDPNADPNDPSKRGYFQLQGSDALKAYSAVSQQIEQQRQAISANLNPAQRIQFEADSRRYSSMLQERMGEYADQQGKAYQAQTAQATVSNHLQDASLGAAANDDKLWMAGVGSAQQAQEQFDTARGADPETIQANKAKVLSTAWDTRIKLTAATDPLAAQTMLTRAQGSLEPDAAAALTGYLQPKVRAAQAAGLADGALAGGGVPTGSGGPLPAGPLPAKIVAAAAQQGVDPSVGLTIGNIESGLGRTPDRGGVQYIGPFQMGDAAWAARGGTDANRRDPDAQVSLGIANVKHSQDVAQAALGTQPAGWQTYIVHQQGDAGGTALLKADPTANAVTALAPAYGTGPAAADKATAAIKGNGGDPNGTVGQFLQHWQQTYASHQVAPPDASTGAVGAATGTPPVGTSAAAAVATGGPAPAIPPAQPGNAMPLVANGYGAGGFGSAPRVVIGDSLGVGIMQSGSLPGIAQASVPPSVVRDRIAALPDGALAGKQVVISTGLSNSGTPQQRQSDLAIVQQQVDAAKAKGASSIVLAGVGDARFPGTNAAIQAVAQRNGAAFTGPAPTADAAGVHPGPAGYRAMLQAAPAPPASGPAVPAAPVASAPGVPSALAVPVPSDGGYAPGPGVARPPTPTPDSPHDTPANGAPPPAAPAAAPLPGVAPAPGTPTPAPPASSAAPAPQLSAADRYKANYDTISQQVRAQATAMHPDDPQFAELAVARVQQRMGEAIRQQDMNYKADNDLVLQAVNGDLAKGTHPASIDQMVATSPAVAAAWDRMQQQQPAVAHEVATRLLSANAHQETGDAKTLGGGFMSAFHRIHAADGDPSKITDVSQLYPMVGEPGGLTMEGLTRARNELAGRSTTDGEAESAMRSGFFKTARDQISGADDGLGIKDPKGEEQNLRFMAAAYTAIDAGKKAGLTPQQMYNPDDPHYVGKLIPQFRRTLAQRVSDMNGANAPPAAAPAPSSGGWFGGWFGGGQPAAPLNLSDPAVIRREYQAGRMTPAEARQRLIGTQPPVPGRLPMAASGP